MPLAMSRPWKHPNSGLYWLRKGVPEDLRALVGKREEKRSLQTRDPTEAKRRHAEALAEIELRWANLRTGPKALTEIEAHQMAATIHDRWLQHHQNNPSDQTSWRTDLAGRLFAPAQALSMDDIRGGKIVTDIDIDAYEARKMEKWCQELADERLAAYGLVVDDKSRRKLAVAVAAAVQRASLSLVRLAKGEVLSPSALFPTHAKPATPADTRPLAFKFLVDGWSTERRPVAKTVYEWSRVVRQLEKYLGHDDARRLTGEDLVAWKGAMVAMGLRPKTIQDAKIARVKAILQWE
jgi:hypothetical protein